MALFGDLPASPYAYVGSISQEDEDTFLQYYEHKWKV